MVILQFVFLFIIDGQLIFFYLLALVNSAAVNIFVEVFVWTTVFDSLGIYIGAELSYVVILFNFLRNCQTFPKHLYPIGSV